MVSWPSRWSQNDHPSLKYSTTLPKSAKNSKTGSRGMQNEKCWLRVETVFLILVNQDFSSNELRVWILDLVPRFGDQNTGHMKTKVLHSNNLKTILSGAWSTNGPSKDFVTPSLSCTWSSSFSPKRIPRCAHCVSVGQKQSPHSAAIIHRSPHHVAQRSNHSLEWSQTVPKTCQRGAMWRSSQSFWNTCLPLKVRAIMEQCDVAPSGTNQNFHKRIQHQMSHHRALSHCRNWCS